MFVLALGVAVSGLLASPAVAQATVTGRVLDAGGPLPGANVLVLAAADSALVRGGVTTADGTFAVDAVPADRYLVRASFVGYAPSDSAVVLADGERLGLGDIELAEGAARLGEVSVTGARPLFEQRPDRLVVNVGESPTLAGGTALDVIARAPGVSVGATGGVTIEGKQGVRVLIDGREQVVPADAVSDLLASLSADNIASVEVITTPPAGLDAEGDAGFINVVLKRRRADGTSGTVAVSGGYGGGALGSVSATLTSRRGPITALAVYGGRLDGRPQDSQNRRQLGDGTLSRTDSERDPVQNNHSLRLGLDLEVGERTTLRAAAAAYQNRFSMDARTTVAVTSPDAPDQDVLVLVDEVNRWRHGSAGLGLSHAFPGARFEASADVLRYVNANPATYQNTFTSDGASTETTSSTRKDTPLTIAVGALDLAVPAGAVELAIGAKAVASRFDNDVTVEGSALAGGDLDGTSRSDLAEDVLAGYAQLDATLAEATTLRAGLRYEHTTTALDVAGEGRAVDRASGSWFPSLLVARQTEGGTLSASYARRVTRPTFTDLAPFTYFLDPFTLFNGNASLREATSHTVRLSAERLGHSLTLQLASEDSSIARFQNVIVRGRNAQTITSLNVGRTRTAAATLSLPVRVASGWRTENTATLTLQDARVGGERLTEQSVRVRSTHALNLPGGVTAEVSGFAEGPSLVGGVRFEPVWGISAALQRLLGRGRLTLGVQDPFDSIQHAGETVDGDAVIVRTFDPSRPTVQLTYALRFGGDAPARPATTRAGEERLRVE